MKTSRIPLIVIVLAVVCSPQAGSAAGDIHVRQPATYENPDFLPGQIIVKFSPGVSESKIAEINEKAKAEVAYTSRFAGFKVLTFPEAIPPQAMVNVYAKNPNVEYAELNYIAHAFMVPDDSYYGYQWHLDNATHGGIGMEQAWDISTGSGVIVAVVDTGVRSGGPDGIDTIIAGWDFVNSDNNPTDDEGHGTHVAGTIAQNTNNGAGVAGVAFNCSIMPVKVLDAGGSGSYAWIADGIRYAADHGAKVINMSLGGRFGSITLESAVAYAYGKGVTIVCASGNNGSRKFVSYPAAYDAYCIAVGATRYDEEVAYYSNCGNSLDLTAPGGDLNVDQNGDTYGDGVLQETFDAASGDWGYWFYQGTSMASPHVAGVAALIISKGIATAPDDVRNVLESTAEDKGPTGWDSRYGYGIVDAYAALTYGVNPPPTLLSIAVTPPSATIEIDGTQQYTAVGTYSDDSTANITETATWNSSNESVATISASGLATGVGDGSTYVTATLDNITSNQATLNVSPASVELETISVTPASASIEIGGTQAFTAMGTYSNGSTQDITSSATWNSSDTSVATISSGLATGVGEGTTSITAALDGIESDAASLTVTSSSGGGVLSVEFINDWTEVRTAGKNTFVTAFAEVRVIDGGGNDVEGATVTGEWSVAVSGVATNVTNGAGLTVLTSPEAKAPRKGGGLTFVLTIINVEKSGYTYDPDSPDVLEISWP